MGGVSTGYCTREDINCLACPDSGTAYLTLPKGHYEVFDKAHGATTDCAPGQEMKAKELTYVINGIHYALPSHHW